MLTDETAHGVMEQWYGRRDRVLWDVDAGRLEQLVPNVIVVEGNLCRLVRGGLVQLETMGAAGRRELEGLHGENSTAELVGLLKRAFDGRMRVPRQVLWLDGTGSVETAVAGQRALVELEKRHFAGWRVGLYDFVGHISSPEWVWVMRGSDAHRVMEQAMRRYGVVGLGCRAGTDARLGEVTRVVEYTGLSDEAKASILGRVDTVAKFEESVRDELMGSGTHSVVVAGDAFLMLLEVAVELGPAVALELLADPAAGKAKKKEEEVIFSR